MAAVRDHTRPSAELWVDALDVRFAVPPAWTVGIHMCTHALDRADLLRTCKRQARCGPNVVLPAGRL